MNPGPATDPSSPYLRNTESNYQVTRVNDLAFSKKSDPYAAPELYNDEPEPSMTNILPRPVAGSAAMAGIKPTGSLNKTDNNDTKSASHLNSSHVPNKSILKNGSQSSKSTSIPLSQLSQVSALAI